MLLCLDGCLPAAYSTPRTRPRPRDAPPCKSHQQISCLRASSGKSSQHHEQSLLIVGRGAMASVSQCALFPLKSSFGSAAHCPRRSSVQSESDKELNLTSAQRQTLAMRQKRGHTCGPQRPRFNMQIAACDNASGTSKVAIPALCRAAPETTAQPRLRRSSGSMWCLYTLSMSRASARDQPLSRKRRL